MENLYWNEFLRSNNESLVWMKKRVEDAKKLCEKTINDNTIIERMQDLSEKIDSALMFQKFYQSENLDKQVSVGKHWRYNALFKEIAVEHSDTLALFLQSLVERLEQLTETKTGSKSQASLKDFFNGHYFKTPDQTKLASQNVMSECSKAAYGAIPNRLMLRPIIAHWPHPDYAYVGPSHVICLPPHDRTKLCHWAILAHETFHSKLHSIERALDNLERAESFKDSDLKRKSVETLKSMLPDKEAYIKLTELEESVVDNLKIRLGEYYRMLYKDNLSDDFSVPRYFLRRQFREILCDIAATLVAGPAYLAVSCSSVADNIRELYLDVSRHLYDLVHPPDICRIMYQTKLLDVEYLGIDGDEIDHLKSEASLLVSVGLNWRKRVHYGREKKHLWKLMEGFLVVYHNTVTEGTLWRNMLEVADLLLLDRNSRYNGERWKHVLECYAAINKNNKAQISNALPFDFVNMAWLKLLDITEKNLGYEEYCKAYAADKDFFMNIWERVCSVETRQSSGNP